MTKQTDAARRIHAESLELQRLFAATPVPPAPYQRRHPALHAGVLLVMVTVASALLLLLLAHPAVA